MKNLMEKSMGHHKLLDFEKELKFLEWFKDFDTYLAQLFRKSSESMEVLQFLHHIPSADEPDVASFLFWLTREMNVHHALDLGTYFGRSASAIALALDPNSRDAEVVTVDDFRWKHWMPTPGCISSHSEVTRKNFASLGTCAERIKVKMLAPSDEIILFPDEVKFDLCFFNFTCDATHWIRQYQALKNNFIPHRTVIVINIWDEGASLSDLRSELEVIFSGPRRVFACRYICESSTLLAPTIHPLHSRVTNSSSSLKFWHPPDWTHHHQNAYSTAIDSLRQKYHNEDGHVLFIPAVEQFLLEFDEIDQKWKEMPWVGVVHSTPKMFTRYTPDLTRLCGGFPSSRKNCLGLFTLTSLQAAFLRENLKPRIPVSKLFYPGVMPPPLRSDLTTNSIERRMKRAELVQIGSFARDLDWFYNVLVPPAFKKVLLIGDDDDSHTKSAESHAVRVLRRLDSDDYENLLAHGIVVLPVLYDGAAHTILIECIIRNVPILAPNYSSVIDYIGKDYPLLYHPGDTDISHLLSLSMLEMAVHYLESRDKSFLNIDSFISNFEKSSVFVSLPPPKESLLRMETSCLQYSFDVTVCIASYRRTHHLSSILSAFAAQQFSGTIEVIVWNNHSGRSGEVGCICDPFVKSNSSKFFVEVIQSSVNHYCAMRAAVVSLMRSENLLICDDDIIPGPEMVSFFMNARRDFHPTALLCLRGHYFREHSLNESDPRHAWESYESVRFVDDDRPEQLIHFAHADACCLTKQSLHQLASVPLADPSFILVDDYWMSYILSSRFGVPLVKLSLDGNENIISRSWDSDDVKIALHKNPAVLAARYRLYVHHMLAGWPSWDMLAWSNYDQSLIPYQLPEPLEQNALRESKHQVWSEGQTPWFGFNTQRDLSKEDVQALASYPTKLIRIGAVGVGAEVSSGGFDSSLSRNNDQFDTFCATLDLLDSYGVNVIVTVVSSVSSPSLWRKIAILCSQRKNVVGYDLINEPHTEVDDRGDEEEKKLNDPGIKDIIVKYEALSRTIRQVDPITPFVLESTCWGSLSRFPQFLTELQRTCFMDEQFIVSCHFYEPPRLTYRTKNKGRYSYPGDVPIYDNPSTGVVSWNKETIERKFDDLLTVCGEFKIPPNRILVGEVGISRETPGAVTYLEDVLQCCHERGLSCLLYAFREKGWSNMNYEFGTDKLNESPQENNPLIQTIRRMAQKYGIAPE
jgi:hypothetical protein